MIKVGWHWQTNTVGGKRHFAGVSADYLEQLLLVEHGVRKWSVKAQVVVLVIGCQKLVKGCAAIFKAVVVNNNRSL
jgi:hypothetical protein